MRFAVVVNNDSSSTAMEASTLTLSCAASLGSSSGDEGNTAVRTWLDTLDLSGRTTEKLRLLKAYASVVHEKSANVVLIHGQSGCGKTSLVEHSLRQTVMESNGFFVSSKCFQQTVTAVNVRQPHSALLGAFSDLCDLVAQSSDFETRRVKIKEDMGGQHGLGLSRQISGLAHILGDDSCEDERSTDNEVLNESTFRNHRSACKTFLQAMACNEHPVCVFVDDVQWIDSTSLDILVALLNFAELRHVMLVLAYRDEEDAIVQDLLLCNDIMHDLIDIPLENLNARSVHNMVTGMLGATSPQIRLLSELVFQKTLGNPFYIKQFMETIRREKLLLKTHNTNNNTWIFDVDTIRAEIRICAAQALLLTRKIDLLTQENRSTLAVASIIGYQFQKDILKRALAFLQQESTVKDTHSDSVSATLEMATREGYLEDTSDGEFRFTHDKIQTLFQSLPACELKKQIHRAIGSSYMETDLDDRFHHAARHLNEGTDIICQAQKISLARINFQAAKFCLQKSAFLDARSFLQLASGLLPYPNVWADYFDLVSQITKMRVRVELVVGNFNECKALIQEALLFIPRSRKAMMIDFLLMDVEVRMITHDSSTIMRCHEALHALGVKVPSTIRIHHVLLRLLKARKLLARLGDSQITSLPLIEDVRVAASIKLLFHACCYSAVNTINNDNAFVYYTLLASTITMQKGLSPFSSPTFAAFGLVESAMENYEQCNRCVHLAEALQSQLHCDETTAATSSFVLCLVHLYQNLEEVVVKSDAAVSLALHRGDTMFGSFLFANGLELRLFSGCSFDLVDTYMRGWYRRLIDLGQDQQPWPHAMMQFAANMRSQSLDFSELTMLKGEFMDECHFEQHERACSHAIITFNVYYFKMQLAFHFGYPGMVVILLKKMQPFQKNVDKYFNFFMWYFLGAMTYYHFYDKRGRLGDLRKARWYFRALRRLSFCPNTKPLLSMLMVQDLVARGKPLGPVMTGYYQAIRDAGEAMWPHLEGLANEAVARYLVKQDRLEDARVYIREALDLYKNKWKSPSKYNWLKNDIEKDLGELGPELMCIEVG